mmetsp:Transcript_18585/g.53075  ORF Transcript_18585/g.53075 Transcript_18585/m.53075 type:complete len:257 (+) Transcript_18585:1714-2484(+)
MLPSLLRRHPPLHRPLTATAAPAAVEAPAVQVAPILHRRIHRTRPQARAAAAVPLRPARTLPIPVVAVGVPRQGSLLAEAKARREANLPRVCRLAPIPRNPVHVLDRDLVAAQNKAVGTARSANRDRARHRQRNQKRRQRHETTKVPRFRKRATRFPSQDLCHRKLVLGRCHLRPHVPVDHRNRHRHPRRRLNRMILAMTDAARVAAEAIQRIAMEESASSTVKVTTSAKSVDDTVIDHTRHCHITRTTRCVQRVK